MVDLKAYTESTLVKEQISPIPRATATSKFTNEYNSKTISDLLEGKKEIIDNTTGQIVVGADGLGRCKPDVRMSTFAVDFFLKTIEAVNGEKVIIVDCQFLNEYAELIDVLKKIRKYDEKTEGASFLDFDQLHVPVFKIGHFAVISIERLRNENGTQGFHIWPKCSLSKKLDKEVLLLISAFKAYYKESGVLFDHTLWRCPEGRDPEGKPMKRAASQGSNGLNCGAFCCFNIETMVQQGVAKPTFRNVDADKYRRYMLHQIVCFVDSHPVYSFRDVDDRPPPKLLAPKRKKMRRSTGGREVIDLTDD